MTPYLANDVSVDGTIETDMELTAIFFVILSLTLSPLSCYQSSDRELSRETLSYLISYESLSQLDTLDEKHKPKPYNISTPCRAFLTELSKHGSEFIRCSIDKSRPFRLCMSCGQSYTKTMRTFDDIQEVNYRILGQVDNADIYYAQHYICIHYIKIALHQSD